MALQFSVAVRNARLAAIETTVGAAPTIQIRTGAAPANCAAADSGTVLATLALPSDWMGAPSAGVVDLLGTWQDPSSDATGTAAHWRLKAGSTCHAQGTVGIFDAQNPKDMIVTSVDFVATQPFQVTQFQLTEGNA
jgi:hypothetical protein